MPYRPEAELKRPDLKGEFLCGHCGKTFCHAASLNRHRLNFHGDDQQCLVCATKIPHNETIRRHMQTQHDIHRVFTCGCCNWTFPDKKELHSHNNSMMKSGLPGDAKVIAMSSRKPVAGSLSQHELRGEERTPRSKKRSSEASFSPEAPTMNTDPNHLMRLLSGLLMAQQSQAPVETPTQVTAPADWVNTLMQVNPALLPILTPMQPSSATSTSSDMESSEPANLDTVLASIGNNNVGEAASTPTCDDVTSGAEEENIDVADDGKDLLVKAVGVDFLSVKTEQPVSASYDSAESGIGSGPTTNTPSPSSTSPPNTSISPGSAASIVTDAIHQAKRANKRRSVDDICFNLVIKRSFADSKLHC
ncbi:hypothetical protein L3Y34_001090 [Caenorhabditis briggsae]|uniref:C2H2-type domain-containing protein n=1 Tax=Caenorhabditis briggsae TaxID=6238 RepID=A0AAE9IPE2_CAEBR|nr:hypothetical protein L3Y34_001090 [Caenorhabditis briggsae]